MKTKEKNAIVLARVSTLQQELESQTEKVIAAAKADGYANPIIIQNKESGVKNDEAHLLGITEMKQYIEAGNIAVVYCSELSRLSRRPKDLYAIRDYLLEHEVQLICLNPYFKLLNEEKKLDATASVVFALYSSFAEQECLLRTERCVRGKLKKKAEGRFVGGKCPMGYSRDKDDNFIINKTEAKVIKRIYKEFASGKSKLAIARDLRAEGMLQNFQTAQYAHTHIDNVLKNEDYTGLHGKPQIISKQLFEQVKRIFEQNRRAVKVKTKRLALAVNLMEYPDSECPKKKYYVNTRAGYYYCILDMDETKKRCIDVRGFDALLWYRISQEWPKRRLIGGDNEVRTQRISRINLRIAHLQEQLSSYDGQIEKIEERLIMQKISDSKAEELEQKVENARRMDKRIIEGLMREREELENSTDIWSVALEEMTDEIKVEVTRKLIEKIELYPVKRCHWRCVIYWMDGIPEEIYIRAHDWVYERDGEALPVGHYRGKGMSDADRKYIKDMKIKYPR